MLALYVGSNFGCTALFGYWVRLAKLCKLPHSFVRMSDGGPDNTSAATHAFHWLAVHMGVFQRLEWVRLPTKHSHNFADRTFSMLKETIFPKRGADGGCEAPWDLEKKLLKALKSQNAPVELVWQWQNYDWAKWFKDMKAIDRDFGTFSGYRHWVYEVCVHFAPMPLIHECMIVPSDSHTVVVPAIRTQYDATLKEHGYVRVTYKAELHDPELESTSATDDPWHPIKIDQGKRVTDPKGLMFMSEGVKIDLTVPPAPEKWLHGDLKDAEGLQKKDVWRKSKVMSDIVNHTMLSFSKEKQDQWRALNEFHLRYKHSDEVPNLSPFSIKAGVIDTTHNSEITHVIKYLEVGL